MTKIVILGAGVMGSAIAIPAASHSRNHVTLVGSPLDDEIINQVQEKRHHPTLNTRLPDTINALRLDELSSTTLHEAELIVVGVSSAGIAWLTNYLETQACHPPALALVTKGLVEHPGDKTLPPQTYADALSASITAPSGRIVGIGGPCIARELALGYPTRVTFAANDEALAKNLRAQFQTDYYRITTHHDIATLEACAALKNFLCIGVSAMFSTYPLDSSHAKNPLAGLFNQAVKELLVLSQWIAGASAHARHSAQHTSQQALAFDLAGMGDLHVTVGGGRNSRLGNYLGEGMRVSEIINGPMAAVTVEGMDTGRNMTRALDEAYRTSALRETQLPLTNAILASINHDELFKFDFAGLPE